MCGMTFCNKCGEPVTEYPIPIYDPQPTSYVYGYRCECGHEYDPRWDKVAATVLTEHHELRHETNATSSIVFGYNPRPLPPTDSTRIADDWISWT